MMYIDSRSSCRRNLLVVVECAGDYICWRGITKSVKHVGMGHVLGKEYVGGVRSILRCYKLKKE